VIRPGGPEDARFLRDMVRHAYFWRMRDPSSEYPVARYVDRWGRRGDTAVIAIEGYEAVGAAWYRLFTRAEPGYAFVDEQTPELTIAVLPALRGRGLGEQLLTALLERARRDGVETVSLSVEPGNRARKLYERHGFSVVADRGDACVMKAQLRSNAVGEQPEQPEGEREMEYDVAVLGGGPGGYTAAIRAAQLGAKVACIEQEPELGGTCLRVGCIPTKAWVQTAFALKEAHESFGKFGVKVSGAELDFAASNAWKDGVVKQMTGGVAGLLKANGVTWVKGTGRFKDANTIAVEGGEDVTFKSAIVATGSYPLRPPIPGLDSARCVDSTGLLAQTEVPKRLVILGGGIIGCEFASIFAQFGSEVTIIEMLPRLIPSEDDDAAKELAKQFGKRGIKLELGKQCTGVEDTGGAVRVAFGDNESVEADLMLVAVGRGPLVEGLGLEEIGVELDRRKGIAADERRRTTVPHIYAVGDCAGYWQLAHTAFREGEVAAENACGHDAIVDARAVPRPIYTDPEIAGVGLTEAEAREQYGDNVAVGQFPWAANARAVMQDATVGWVKTIHETQYGELLGMVMVGPHVTDMIEAGVVALDAEATIETVADGIAPHPTLSEAIKEAGLVALGRAIHVPNRKPRAKSTA
jgi:dihydrolipoamide dehydrogenase